MAFRLSTRLFAQAWFAQTWIAVAVCCLGTSMSGMAQELAQPAHLVGHEESALLLRAQQLIDDWDPRKLENPYVETTTVRQANGTVKVNKQLRRADLTAFIADVEAAEALGKAFFWEMQAGSDFRRTADGTFIGTACASCHYRFGADGRDRNTVRIPYVAWEHYDQHDQHPLEFGEKPLPFNIEQLATESLKPLDYQHGGPFSLIVGSQGVPPRVFKGYPDNDETATTGAWDSELSEPRPVLKKDDWISKPEWSMFFKDQTHESDFHSRQITNRNSPSVINSGFADRLFHDGRAESTFNGFSIFGDADPREVIHKRQDYFETDGQGNVHQHSRIVHARVAITKAALASQAVGPIVNEIEMSYLGRTFPNLAKKLLDRQILKYQTVSAEDSVFGPLDKQLALEFPAEACQLTGAIGRKSYTFRQLIRRAFKPEWWDWEENDVPLVLLRSTEADGRPLGHLMEANFPLYWGLSLMLYQASLVSNQSPFDQMMRGQSGAVETKWAAVKDAIGEVYLDRSPRETQELHPNGISVFQHGFRVFLDRGCVECHSGPLMSELYERLPEDVPLPIDHMLQRVLLPNSRADSIAIVKQRLHDTMIRNISHELTNANPALKSRASLVALELDLLREHSQKAKDKLLALVTEYLTDQVPAERLTQVCTAIRDELMSFENRTSGPLGNRWFFTEEERIALAEQLADRVLVERMAIPPKLQQFRTKLPLGGIQEKGYAFYDLGFYNLGVAPPRYDRGIGDAGLDPLLSPIESALELLRRSNVAGERTVAHEMIAAAQAADDQLAALQEKFTDSQPELLERVITTAQAIEKQRGPKRRSLSSSPGSAYQFDPSWYRDEFKSPKRVQPGAAEAIDPAFRAAAVDEGIESRSSTQGPRGDLDEKFWNEGPYLDTSWDRIDIDPEQRRANIRFKSRARELVTDEMPWGYRKPLTHDNELAFWGAFKTPTLRNVELTAPYMHNGRLMTLRDVIEFYDRDDDEVLEEIDDETGQLISVPRDKEANPDVHPAIVSLNLTLSDRRALEFFLRCLTDERVDHESAPFDHPSLQLVNGYKQATGGGLEENIEAVEATTP